MNIKGFDEHLKCRGFQFEVGKEYKINNPEGTELKCCTDTVFHYCKSLKGVHGFYSVFDNNRFCEIEVLGEEVTDDAIKFGSDHIRIVREITGEELNELKGLVDGNTGLFNNGNHNRGDCNSGDWNSGNCNSGNCNSGNHNSGNCNSGDWNATNYSSGCFNTKQQKIYLFNKPSKWTRNDWLRSSARNVLLYAPCGTRWVAKDIMTKEEKAEHPEYKKAGGYLYKYTNADRQNWWNGLSEKCKDAIKSIPNFDADIFRKITGIDVAEDKQ